LTGVLTSELVLSLIGRTRIRAHGFLNFNDSADNTGKLSLDRDNNVRLEVNSQVWETRSSYSVEGAPA